MGELNLQVLMAQQNKILSKQYFWIKKNSTENTNTSPWNKNQYKHL